MTSFGNITAPKSYCASTPNAPLFGASRQIKEPDKIDEARFTNGRIPVNSDQLAQDLLARLDEAMTVTGEVYAGNEAFTNIIEVNIDQKAPRGKGKIQTAVDTRVENATNVGKAQNIGIMVLTSDAKDASSGAPIATARATFNAIDSEALKSNLDQDKLMGVLQRLANSVLGTGPAPDLQGLLEEVKPAGSMKPVPVTPLQTSPAEQAVSDKAGDWNKNLSGFYKGLAGRLEARNADAELPTLTAADNSKYRLVNQNVYVTTDMLNKKQTGHGGIAVANAVDDMQTLLEKAGRKGVVQRVSANYLAPFHASDSLQFDTTIDHVEKTDAGAVLVLSSRISKMDTKSRKVEGPIILAHAKVLLPGQAFAAPTDKSADAQARKEEAVAWSRLA